MSNALEASIRQSLHHHMPGVVKEAGPVMEKDALHRAIEKTVQDIARPNGVNAPSESPTPQMEKEAAPFGGIEKAIKARKDRLVNAVSQAVADVEFQRQGGADLIHRYFNKGTPEADKAKRLFQNMVQDKSESTLGRHMAYATVGAAPFIAFAGLQPMVSSLLEARKQKTQFRTMMEQNPHLQEADARKASEAFQVLQAFSPSMAAQPTVAGDFVAKMLEYEVVDPATVKQLTDIEKAMSPSQSWTKSVQDTGMSVLQTGLQEAVKTQPPLY